MTSDGTYRLMYLKMMMNGRYVTSGGTIIYVKEQ